MPAKGSTSLGKLEGHAITAGFVKANDVGIAAGTVIFHNRLTGETIAGPNISAVAKEALKNGTAVVLGENGEVTPLNARSVRELSKDEYRQLAHVYTVYQNNIQKLLEEQRAAKDRAEKDSLNGRVSVGDPNAPAEFARVTRVTRKDAKDDDKLQQAVGRQFGKTIESRKIDSKFFTQTTDRKRKDEIRQKLDTEAQGNIKENEASKAEERLALRKAQGSGLPTAVPKRRRRGAA